MNSKDVCFCVKRSPSAIYSLAVSVGVFLSVCLGAKAERFPVDSKGVQATIVAVSGINTSSALAIGQIQDQDLREFCNRAAWAQFSFAQCIRQNQSLLGSKYSSSANCLYKLVTVHWGPTYRLASKRYIDGYTEYVWRDENSGDVLNGSEASGAPTVTSTYQILCPSFK